jgi:predicted nucleotidyltransferase
MATELESQLRSILARHPEVRLAYLFGSLARDRARTSSDIDIAVLADSPLSAETKTAIIGEIAETTGRPVDLVDIATAGEPLLGEVLKGRRLLGSATLHGDLLSRHLIDAADFGPYQARILKERRDAWTQ